jgi:RNA polymerase sigma factor (sigma-70 family)
MISVLPLLRRFTSSRPCPKQWEGASDVELALAARVQDRAGKEAFVEIVQRHQTAVAAVAYSVTGRIGFTDDIAQETFLRAWKRMGTLREPAKLKAWLTKIAHDCAVDVLRREKPHTSLDDERVSLTEAMEQSPDKAAADGEDEQMVWAALAELPETVRTPLVLFYREGQSVAGVAAALDLSEDAVKQRLSRGREALREQVTARIEGVLGRVRPSVLLVVTIAGAIGLLSPPAVLAAGAFSGTTAAASAGAGTAAPASTFSTAMTASSYLVATITMAAFVPLGWKAREPETPAPSALAPVVQKTAPLADPFAKFSDSALLKEWLRLHEVHGTDAAAMPELYKSISDVKDTFHRRALRSALLAEWAAVDPEGAFRHLHVEKKHWEQTQQLLREWLALDPAAAASYLAAHVSGAESLARSLVKELAEVAPEQMAAIAAQLPASTNYWRREVAEAFTKYAAKDPAAARAAAEAITGPCRVEALAGVAQGWAEKDGDAALAWSRTLKEGPERDAALRATVIGWAKKDPVAAMDHIDAAPPAKEEMTFASDTAARVLLAAAEKDFDVTLRWLETNGGKIGNESWLGLSSAVQKRFNADPVAWMEFFAAQSPAMRRGLKQPFESVILNDGYPQKDAVWSWLKTRPHDDFTDGLRSMLMRTASWKEPQLAMQWMAEMPDSQETQRLVEQNLSNLVNRGADLARIDELLAKAPEKLRAGLLATAFSSEGDWRMSDLQPWIARMAELPAEQRPQAAASLAGRMAATDPQAAITWATSLTNEEERRNAIGSVATRWANADSYEASQWIASLPEGGERDAAARALVRSIAQSDPESAWTWATSIGNASERTVALTMALTQVKERDPQRALQLVQTLDANAAGRSALLEVLGQPGSAEPSKPR